ncbi:hypothetical protein D1816_02070 [Aquimarina sp. AD10]|uniref:SnoaL-like domain-containing protein n=1 Tax=Aquimarina aggregata TaxID=1642818 RepID=A0A163B668_9FLAO|nr:MULTISPECIES: hypothetical protein [Aquimarina]AXT59182.1 hypothetical protein D1816_02070 [Aquimarina sp. AD10]KZS41091.1 hypothetical protein AWE51_23340 [Aquimarina aggregata]RKM93889.1 hypothetical protein D7033_19095 [Aquimarina sp. AD10]
MRKIIILSFFLIIGFISCKTSENKVDKLEIAKRYYKALDNSDGTAMKILLTDSLMTKEMDYDYEQTFSQNEYINKWLKWDSVFDPTYKILEIKQENEVVVAKVSKIDKRIRFLHEGPTVWSAVIRFNVDKISSIERKNVTFNENTWGENRTKLLTWIEKNHPELNGFLYDQTKSGGIKYLKAIELFKNKK